MAAPYEVRSQTGRHTEIESQGRTLRLSNREKVLYPQSGFTKGQLIDYYAAVAPVLLGHLAGRPLTLKRYPDGVRGRVLLREALPHAPPRVGADRRDLERSPARADRLLPRRRPAHA